MGQALLLSPCSPLPPEEKFPGAGLYALYYEGDFDAYKPVSGEGCAWPIYVGRAMPAGGRSGLLALDASVGPKLFQRLREHGKSIEAAENLRLEDFRCRYLVVDDIWIPLAERLLIGHYSPLWNAVVDGFGGHAPGGEKEAGKSRGGQAKSLWDTLHPGRGFARGREEKLPESEIRARIKKHLVEHPPLEDEAPILGEESAKTSELSEDPAD